MIFNLFLPLISFVIYFGSDVYSNFFLTIAFILTSLSMTLYVSAMSYEVFFNEKELKKVYSELPMTSLQRHWLRSVLGYCLIFMPTLGILYLSYTKGAFNYTIWWTFIFFMLVFFMCRLKNIKKELVNKKIKESYEEK